MYQLPGIGLETVQAVYAGPERLLWELLMGEQIHLGGLKSSLALAECANIQPGTRGVDLCCCTGAGMRCLLRFRQVAAMTGVDATPAVLELARNRAVQEGVDGKLNFVLANVCATGLPSAQADFVWGEDAWCYVVDKDALIREAVRLVKPEGTIAFTDWVAGKVAMTAEEGQRFLQFMKFPNILSLDEYVALLRREGMDVLDAEDTLRFAPCMDLYVEMAGQQLTYDMYRILGFDVAQAELVGREMGFLQELAHAGKVAQGMFVARKERGGGDS
ncbi:MAG: class I SAM-dependent methyltransferase [Candidatus Hydrogenedentes bacterium]|nr:class I SAM-dependent methyltransferase [Candidatus Hydrogenedentota bacterium]MBI3117404.1 class I SAM-dependent methyltransferase [Candidatus Hydrogenedentota bacterium]